MPRSSKSPLTIKEGPYVGGSGASDELSTSVDTEGAGAVGGRSVGKGFGGVGFAGAAPDVSPELATLEVLVSEGEESVLSLVSGSAVTIGPLDGSGDGEVSSVTSAIEGSDVGVSRLSPHVPLASVQLRNGSPRHAESVARQPRLAANTEGRISLH